MSNGYQPPFTITDKVMNLIIEIGELAGEVAITHQLSSNPTLRRENRIRSIHSSLAIEQNSLTIEQVSDVINGKRILGKPVEIREVKNAYEAYEIMQNLNPYLVKDLLKGHKILMQNLVNEAGMFRSKGVGVYAGTELIHAGTPPQYVADLITDLFIWLKESEYHPLVKSCIFHYEFEFIHPFADGNGRMGRMWHTLILSKWKDFFAWLPIETLIHERQEDYYQALNAANTQGESTIFVEFMLVAIKDALGELYNTEKNSSKLAIDNNKLAIENSKLEIDNSKIAIEDFEIKVMSMQVKSQTKVKIKTLYQKLGTEKVFGRTDVADLLGISSTGAGDLISKLNKAELIEAVTGQGKGKYKLK